MEESRVSYTSKVIGYLVGFFRRCLFSILSMGPIPSHLAFIMDGNRRFAKKLNLKTEIGHRAGFSALLSMLKYCCDLGVKHVTFYAFSIDNFRRRPDDVQILMDLLLEKAEGFSQLEGIVEQYGVRVFFLGNLKLLREEVQIAVEKVAMATSKNTKCMLLICISYTSTDEIRHAVEESCANKFNKIDERMEAVELDGKKIDTSVKNGVHESLNHVLNGIFSRDVNNLAVEKVNKCNIKLVDVEKHMYMAVAPDPDVLIRTSGETRLSNFLLWQTSFCILYSPDTLWPEIGLWELVWAVISYQRHQFYLEKKKKQY